MFPFCRLLGLASSLLAFVIVGEVGAEPWLVQLQEAKPAQIMAEGWKDMIIDYSPDSTDERAFKPADIQSLKKAGGRVLCYLSVGEAESYRSYWQPTWLLKAPAWLGRANPDWPGNYKVRFWDPAWREGVLGPQLDAIVKQGFDGLYLDIVDAYEYWADEDTFRTAGEQHAAADPKDIADSAQRMSALIQWLQERAKSAGAKPSFAIVPQNCESLFDHDPEGKALNAIAGVGAEDVFFDEITRRTESEYRPRLEKLRKLKESGKFVLVIDYVDDGSGTTGANGTRTADLKQLCQKEGFSYFIAPRNRKLDRTHPLPGLQP
jgi:cysteinyl-tRNA synthetase, unknown class